MAKKLLRMVCRELMDGATLQETADRVGLNKAAVYRLVRDLDIPRARRTRLTPDERAEILAAILSTNSSRRALARQFGRAASTIVRIAQSRSGERFATHQKLRSTRRCHICGAKVNQWPCVACVVKGRLAQQAKQA